jgi:AraC family transcriptional regulator
MSVTAVVRDGMGQRRWDVPTIEPTGQPTWWEVSPVEARSGRARVPTAAVSYDCVLLVFIRHGHGRIFTGRGPYPIRAGDLVVLSPGIVHGGDPDPHGVEYSTVFLEPDFLATISSWSRVGREPVPTTRRSDIGDATERPRTVHLGEAAMSAIAPCLDELVTLSEDHCLPGRLLRALALLFAIFDVVEPLVSSSGHDARRWVLRARTGEAVRRRPFEPLRAEAAHAVSLMRANPERQWTLDDLAREVGLSSRHLRRIFGEAFGRSPHEYLTHLRAELLASALCDPAVSIEEAMRRVGWTSPDYASRLFRRHIGLSPRAFRDRFSEPPRPATTA